MSRYFGKYRTGVGVVKYPVGIIGTQCALLRSTTKLRPLDSHNPSGGGLERWDYTQYNYQELIRSVFFILVLDFYVLLLCVVRENLAGYERYEHNVHNLLEDSGLSDGLSSLGLHVCISPSPCPTFTFSEGS